MATSALAAQPAAAQHQRQVRHYNAQGRPYYRGPFHITLAGGTGLYNGDLGNSLGDNFYGDSRSLEVLRAKYLKLAEKPSFRRSAPRCR